jgi:hypothetical protein
MRTKPPALKCPPDVAPLMAKLTPRQRLFCEAYATRGNATRAATIAGYAWPGKSGPRLTTFPAVKAVLEAQFAIWRYEQELEWRKEFEERQKRWNTPPTRVKRRRRRGRKWLY